ncbi:MAG: site-2 protease family protein [Chitinophagaceae bacterium]|nr:site-2 protease family protein [Chitinophagaceae bacterium]
MEHLASPLPDNNDKELAAPESVTGVYPPKFEKQDPASNIWMKSFTSLALYLAFGYYIFKRWDMLLLITAIVMIHELGHFFAMKYFRYNDLGIFFIPLLGAYVSGRKREVSQKQSAIILLAGPLPGMIIGIILYILEQQSPGSTLFGIPVFKMSILFVLLNLINLFPVYPLDGGQLLNRVFLEEESWVSNIFIFLSAGLMCWLAWNLYASSHQPLYFTLLLFPLMMLLRLQTDSRYKTVEKRLESEQINTDVSYEDLSNEDYWRIRNILIEEQPGFRDFNPSPPYEYHPKEERIMTIIQSLLHRNLIQDVSITGKIFILLIWGTAIASPWLLKMDMSFLNRLGY